MRENIVSEVDLLVAPCDFKAAKFAVEHWHYSASLPQGRTFKCGVWENSSFIGAVVFSYGANRNMMSPYGLKFNEGCELVRVALTSHVSHVSKILSHALRLLKKRSPGLRLVVSYADPLQGHEGKIYQASNWIYSGTTSKEYYIKMPSGKILHKKSAHNTFGHTNADLIGAEWVVHPAKHKYLYPLDRAMRRQIEKLARAYPKRNNADA